MIPMGEGPGGERGFGKASKLLGHVAADPEQPRQGLAGAQGSSVSRQ
jgi:hypothetical protein